MEEYYMASKYSFEYTYTTLEGITPSPESGLVPLCTTIEGAVDRYLEDAQEHAGINPKNVKTLTIYEIELPALAPTCKMENLSPELKQYDFIGYIGTIPPNCIVKTFSVDLFDMDLKAGDPFHVEEDLYFAIKENELPGVKRDGFALSETMPEAPRGVVLTTDPYDAAALYSAIYKTKENGITSLAVVCVCFPPFVNLQSDVALTIPGAVEPIRAFIYDGKIPPEYMKDVYVMDINEEAAQ